MKDRFETGRKLLSMLGSSDGFLRRGLTMAVLKESGTVPDCKELLMISRIEGRSTGKQSE